MVGRDGDYDYLRGVIARLDRAIHNHRPGYWIARSSRGNDNGKVNLLQKCSKGDPELIGRCSVFENEPVRHHTAR